MINNFNIPNRPVPHRARDRKIVNLVPNGFQRGYTAGLLDLRHDHTNMRNRNYIGVLGLLVHLIHPCPNPCACIIPTFATGRGDIAGLFPLAARKSRVARNNLIKSQPIPFPKMKLA